MSHRCRFETLSGVAASADEMGFDSLWLSDHLFFDIGKYGGSSEPAGAFEPIATLGALSRVVERARLGTLVVCEALRPATVLAKGLATLDRLTDGRLDVGLGAGWYEPEYAAIGMDFPPPGGAAGAAGRGIDDRDRDARPRRWPGDVRRQVPPGRRRAQPSAGRATASTAGVRRREGRPAHPARGGAGRRLEHLLGVDAGAVPGSPRRCWRRRATDVGRDPASVWKSLGLYALCGENEADLARRFERLQANTPPGVLDGTTLEQWRVGRLVGTVEQIREQAATWGGLGVETLILGVGAVPFHVGAADDVALLAEALRVTGDPAPAG